MGQRKSGLVRQVHRRFNSCEIFYDSTRKRCPFNTSDCLIEVTTQAGLTSLSVQSVFNHYDVVTIDSQMWHSVLGQVYEIILNIYCIRTVAHYIYIYYFILLFFCTILNYKSYWFPINYYYCTMLRNRSFCILCVYT